jgi:hypothetical protein
MCPYQYLIPFCFQRITQRQEGGPAGVYFNTLRKADDEANKVSQRMRLGMRTSASKRCLQGIRIQVAAGHDHNHFLACKTVFYFVNCHQRNGACAIGQIICGCQRHPNPFQYLVFGQQHYITYGVLENGIRQRNTLLAARPAGRCGDSGNITLNSAFLFVLRSRLFSP